jgi:hypothetical protein
MKSYYCMLLAFVGVISTKFFVILIIDTYLSIPKFKCSQDFNKEV